MRAGLSAAALLLLAAPALVAPVSAAPAPAAAAAAAGPRQFGDFTVRCVDTKSVAPCDMFEERVNKETGQRVMSLSIGYMPSQSRYIMQIAVPLGVDLDKGVVIAAGKFTSPSFLFRRCDGTGCYVEAGVTRELIDAFAKAGTDGKFKVVADGGKEFSFTFSFAGFSAAHDDMVAQNKAKAINPDNAELLAAPAKK
jgi:invasion protein IalB